jgi:hypothetical protein
VWLLSFFVLWVGLSFAAAVRWLGGAFYALQDLSVNIFVFFIVVLQGAELRRVNAIRRTVIAALLLTLGFGLPAYYFGTRQAQFVLLERLETTKQDEPGEGAGFVSDFTARLTGRGPRAAAESAEASAHAEGSAQEDGIEPGSRAPAGPTVPRLRALGFLNDPNDLAQTLVAGLPLVALAWRRRRLFNNFFFVALPVIAMLWAVVLTRSRGGLVALAALLWFAFAQWTRPRWARVLRWAGFVGLLVLLTLFFRLGGADESAMGRLEAWSEGLQMLKHSPIWGVGFAQFSDKHVLVAHNSFVHCFAELGLVGYFAWLGAIVATFWYLERIGVTEANEAGSPELVRWARALGLSLLTFLAGALFLSRAYSVSLFLLVGMGTALAGVAQKNSSLPEAYSIPVLALWVRTGALVLMSVVLTYVVVVIGR